ncbi:MAG TPA: rod shape-determining protein [Actinomycetota bacterium]|nr:rod shape-determining protein [Actinomycetota bacterium]
MGRDLAIDLGTANTLIYASGRGIVLNEPTVIALNKENGQVLAVGHEAFRMIGRTPGYIVAERPLRRGAISDFDITEKFLRLLMEQAGANRRFGRPRVLICIPSAITEVERRALLDAATAAGARSAHLVEEPVAAAIGAGLPIHEPTGNLVVDIGGGTSEVAVIAMGGIVVNTSVRVGGFDIDDAITRYIRREYAIVVGERTAEQIKIAIGSAFPLVEEEKAEIKGRDLATGLPKVVQITSEEMREAIADPVSQIVQAVVAALASTPPELGQDVLSRGIALTGGGGMLRGLDMLIAEECDVPVHLTERPLECVALGAGKCLEAFSALKDLFIHSTRP